MSFLVHSLPLCQFQQDLVDLIMIHLASIELYWSCCDYRQETIGDHNEVMILSEDLVPEPDHFAHVQLSFIVLISFYQGVLLESYQGEMHVQNRWTVPLLIYFKSSTIIRKRLQ